MAIDTETKKKVIELYFTHHKNIRVIVKEVQKSSRDIVAVVKEYKQGLQQSSQASTNEGENANQPEREDSVEPPVNVKAYDLFTKGLTQPQVASELNLSEADATKYYTEFLRLKKLPNLASILERLRVPEKINAFIELTNLALAEHMRASKVIQLLKMANSPIDGMCNIEQKIEKHRLLIEYLRKTKHKEQLEHAAIHDKISSANGMLKQLNQTIDAKKDELAAILDKKIKYERMVEQFIVNNKEYLKIQTIANDKVTAFLTEYKGRKLLEFALAAVVESLRQKQEPLRELLIKNMPPITNYNYDPEKVFYLNSPCDYYTYSIVEKVLGPSNEIYNKLITGLTDLTISTTAGLERHSYPYNTTSLRV